MRNLTGGNYDDDEIQHPEKSDNPTPPVDADLRRSSDMPKDTHEGYPSMEHPDVHIKNEPRFIDHAMPHHGCGYGGGDGLGLGGGLGGGLLVGALLGRGLFNNGDNNGNHGCERAVFDASILSKLGTIEGQVPLVGAQVAGAIATSTGLVNNTQLQIALGQSQATTTLALATQSQISGVKDAVQSGVYANTLATNAQGEQTRALINANALSAAQAENTVLKTTLLIENLRNQNLGAHHDLVIQNTNTNNNLMQQQQQQGFQIGRLVDAIHCCDQNIRATNQAINIGSGAQIATPTNTSTNNRVN